ncbi:farnesyl-diphosphate farnesyltransferase [Neoconidiobolus thromboides FSU 785]|nr:farnesyl-diphosphate farnesyltransferase [Neoconidiobolus thromboides FSU 785]
MSIKAIKESLFYPREIYSLLKFKFSSNATTQKLDFIKSNTERRCYEFLLLTSRSFAAVILELDEELRLPICLFYLILRGLDTIEDDMSIPLQKKLELLREFHNSIQQKGWTFHENGPNEKDAILLQEFDVVIEEFLKLKNEYQQVIIDITKKMANGMADFAQRKVESIQDWDLYCHYVAGLVGHGLTRLFSVSGLEDPSIADDLELANSMGLFLQKVNIIRDYLEDYIDGRCFWPKEIWNKYVEDIGDFTKEENQSKAVDCLNELCFNALQHAKDCIKYMSKIKNPSCFNFCAIPQVMAISTIALVYNNPDVFKKNVKIRKGEAVNLIMESISLDNVVDIFETYSIQIIKKSVPTDSLFIPISIWYGQVN